MNEIENFIIVIVCLKDRYKDIKRSVSYYGKGKQRVKRRSGNVKKHN